jgi:hypothetical protein
MSSDEDGAELMAAFKRNGAQKSAQSPTEALSSFVAGDVITEPTLEAEEDRIESHDPSRPRRALYVRAKPVDNESEYIYYEPAEEVEEIIREFSRKGEVWYDVRLFGGGTRQVSAHGKGGFAKPFTLVKAAQWRQLRRKVPSYISPGLSLLYLYSPLDLARF